MPVMALGTHLQTLSDRFPEYEKRQFDQYRDQGNGETLNPAGRMALVASFEWQFSICVSGFIAAAYTIGLLSIRALSRRWPGLSLPISFAFGGICLIGALSLARDAIYEFQWGFLTLGISQLQVSAGLLVGGVGMAGSRLNRFPRERILRL